MSAATAKGHETTTATYPMDGGCSCRSVRYRLQTHPLFVHCCHCRWCQRETGSAFVMNAMIESDRVVDLAAPPEIIDTPSESGEGQLVARCPHCHVAVWSHYPGAGPMLKFVRVGTLDDSDRLPPDIHIFTASKQPWVVLPPNVPTVPEFYDREKYWPADSLARRRSFLPSIEAYHHELKQRQVVNTRLVRTSRERLFDAFRDPARLARWWGPNGFRSSFTTFDFRPGGHWVFTMHGPDGRDYANESVFADVTSPARVRLRHVSDPKFELLITLAGEDGGTRIRWRQRFGSMVECDKVRDFVMPMNEQNLDRWEKEADSG